MNILKPTPNAPRARDSTLSEKFKKAHDTTPEIQQIYMENLLPYFSETYVKKKVPITPAIRGKLSITTLDVRSSQKSSKSVVIVECFSRS